jgi:hypothetical protein
MNITEIIAKRSINNIELPKYSATHCVWALKIENIYIEEGAPTIVLEFEDKNFGMIDISESEFKQHNYNSGGYYVVSENGETSFLPSNIFKRTYTEITGKPQFSFRAYNYERNQYFDVLSMITSELNGRVKSYEMNNGYITIWNEPDQARLEVLVNDNWYPIGI